MGWMQTDSGQRMFPLAPDESAVRLRDIATALANKCRFGGMVRRFYSVAEHCIRVSLVLEAAGASPEAVIWGLMHDAAEAYMPDFVAPCKGEFAGLVTFRPGPIVTPELGARLQAATPLEGGLFAEFQPIVVIEARIIAAVTHALKLPALAPNSDTARLVYEADMVLRATEKRDVLSKQMDWEQPLLKPLPDKIKPIMPVEAKVRFLDVAKRLGIEERPADEGGEECTD